VVFALDGVLIGAGDLRYMRNLTIVATLGGFLPAIWLAYGLRLGLGGVWAGLTVFIVIRLVALLARVRSGRWRSSARPAEPSAKLGPREQACTPGSGRSRRRGQAGRDDLP